TRRGANRGAAPGPAGTGPGRRGPSGCSAPPPRRVGPGGQWGCRRAQTRCLPQHFLYFRPLPQGHGSLRPTLGASLTIVLTLTAVAVPPSSPRVWGWESVGSSEPTV